MFMYLDDAFSKSEKLIMTLYQAGAMAQSDLRKVLGWDDYTTSKVITSLNGKGKNKRGIKIGEIIERPGVRNSGKIRFLTKHGLEMAATLIGVDSTQTLNEGEVRIAAQLAKFASSYAEFEYTAYHGHYLVQSRYHLSSTDPKSRKKISIPTPATLIETKYENNMTEEIVWLTWIPQAMSDVMIQQRLTSWRILLKKMLDSTLQTTPIDDPYYRLLVVCQTQKSADQVSEIVKTSKIRDFCVSAMDNLDLECLYRF